MSDTPSSDPAILQTRLSRVDGARDRLTYCGYDIRDLAGKVSFEEVAYLLWNGELPSPPQLATLKEQMALCRTLAESVLRIARALEPTTDPLDALRTCVSALYAEPPLRVPGPSQVMMLTAQFPLLVAAFDRIRRGDTLLEPHPDLHTAANYLYLLHGKTPSPAQSRALDTYLVLLADQAMNASTFAARVVISTRSSLHSAVVAALGALKGPLHGGTAARVADMFEAIGTIDNVEPWIRRALARGERLMGFGQHLYMHTDPRAEILREAARAVSTPDAYALADRVETTALRLVNEQKAGSFIGINVEFYSALLLQQIGLPKDLFASTFAISRVAGWGAHILEQVAHNRLIRPAAEYVGPALRPVARLGERSEWSADSILKE